MMKTIRFRTDDLTQYTINVSQITCIFPLEEKIGSWVYLSCGTRLSTFLTVDDLLVMIKNEE